MSSSPEKIIKYLDFLQSEQDGVEDQILDIVLFSPSGGISLDEAWGLSLGQRNKVIKKINKYVEDQNPKPKPLTM